jgi:hypothetical protein
MDRCAASRNAALKRSTFLGFTHICGQRRRTRTFIVRRVTAAKRPDRFERCRQSVDGIGA